MNKILIFILLAFAFIHYISKRPTHTSRKQIFLDTVDNIKSIYISFEGGNNDTSTIRQKINLATNDTIHDYIHLMTKEMITAKGFDKEESSTTQNRFNYGGYYITEIPKTHTASLNAISIHVRIIGAKNYPCPIIKQNISEIMAFLHSIVSKKDSLIMGVTKINMGSFYYKLDITHLAQKKDYKHRNEYTSEYHLQDNIIILPNNDTLNVIVRSVFEHNSAIAPEFKPNT